MKPERYNCRINPGAWCMVLRDFLLAFDWADAILLSHLLAEYHERKRHVERHEGWFNPESCMLEDRFGLDIAGQSKALRRLKSHKLIRIKTVGSRTFIQLNWDYIHSTVNAVFA